MPRGRPSKFKTEFVKQAAKLAGLGATDREIADFFDVDERTINRWKFDHPAFCQSLKVGKADCDNRVEQTLYRRAVGYSFVGEKVFHFQGHITRTHCVENVAPDVTACIFWLKNRRPEQWRDKPDGMGDDNLADKIGALIDRLPN
jgi:hypothetical protein